MTDIDKKKHTVLQMLRDTFPEDIVDRYMGDISSSLDNIVNISDESIGADRYLNEVINSIKVITYGQR